MNIEICSRERALSLARELPTKVSVISITSKEEKEVDFGEEIEASSVLHLKFNDLWQEYDEEGIPYGRPLPCREDLAGLKAFVDGLDSEILIVHCWEGTSRSAAVAQAVYEYRGCRDNMHTLQSFRPNPLVYSLARCELS